MLINTRDIRVHWTRIISQQKVKEVLGRPSVAVTSNKKAEGDQGKSEF